MLIAGDISAAPIKSIPLNNPKCECDCQPVVPVRSERSACAFPLPGYNGEMRFCKSLSGIDAAVEYIIIICTRSFFYLVGWKPVKYNGKLLAMKTFPKKTFFCLQQPAAMKIINYVCTCKQFRLCYCIMVLLKIHPLQVP